MKRSLWNYLMVGICFALIVLCFVPMIRSACCVPQVNEAGEVVDVSCTYSWGSVLSRMAGCGFLANFLFVIYLLMAGSGMCVSIVSDLLKGDQKLIIASVALTLSSLICMVPLLIFAWAMSPTC